MIKWVMWCRECGFACSHSDFCIAKPQRAEDNDLYRK